MDNLVPSSYLTLGVLAHVDAGKTTLSEAMLYRCGAIRALGRVDHGDALLDYHALERRRGITIFSKQARFDLGDDLHVTLLDTPGHVDFSAEMERALQPLDLAVLVVSAVDGVQAHTETLWRLLKRYQIPTFVFVTKMDLTARTQSSLMEELRRLDPGCVDFTAEPDEIWENAAMTDENALETLLESGCLDDDALRDLVSRRRVFPCAFGSGLKLTGVDEFLTILRRFAPRKAYGGAFGAQVFQILHEPLAGRLTCLRVTGGALRVRDTITYTNRRGETVTEKVTALRRYSGEKFETADEIPAGDVAAVQGLSQTWPGQGLGEGETGLRPALEPVMTYRVTPPKDMSARELLPRLRELEEEDPMLRLVWDEEHREIRMQLMGAVQIEVLQSLIRERFDAEVRLDQPRILYQETITESVEGVGHFEPLRHYAEVHLLLEPAPRGAGILLESRCPEDALDRNWQRLILTHLAEKTHRGVLIGAPLTDVKITLLAGRAHPKHTEGGDFRQATYRAVRQGLMQAESLILEPQYAFRLSVPTEQIGRAISDVRLMHGVFDGPETEGDFSVLTGTAPVSLMGDYAAEVAAYTRGRGRLSLEAGGYTVCHNPDAVIAEIGYDAERDTDNPADSVFCAHGAGTVIPWNQVRDYMHIDTGFGKETEPPPPAPRIFRRNLDLDEKALEEIMLREFGPIRRREYKAPVVNAAADPADPFHAKQQTLIVDGYNVIFAWDELKALARDDLDLARTRLMDVLSNYAGFTQRRLILVFDGYRVRGNSGEKGDYNNIHVVYTKEHETADAYIERIANDIGRNESVRVVTSDSLIRISALRSGVLRTSSKEFHAEVEQVAERIEQAIRDLNQ